MAEEGNVLQTYKQHPIPQNVMGIEFKLVGELTLRQFLYLGVAVLLAYLIYNSSLPSLISYPLSLTVALVGLAAAFLPIQNQSFDQWLIHFFVALTSPTQRVWRKVPTPPDFFYFSYVPATGRPRAPTVKDRARLQEYLRTIKTPAFTAEKSELDLAEESFFKKLGLAPSVGPGRGLPPSVRATYQPFTRPPRKTPQEFNLASEISYAQGSFITIPGQELPHYVPSLRNVRVGRKLSALAEGAAPVRGELELETPPEPEAPLAEKITPLSAVERETAIKKQLAELEAKLEKAKKERPPVRPPTYTAYTKDLPGSYLKLRPVTPLAAEVDRLRQENKVLQEELQKRMRAATGEEQRTEIEKRYQANFSRLSEQNSRLREDLGVVQANFEKMQTYAREVSSKDLDFQKKLREQEEKLKSLLQEKTKAAQALQNLETDYHQQRREVSPLLAQVEALRGQLEPPPLPPAEKIPLLVRDVPNVINGVVKNHWGELLEGAVVIVRDEMGGPVRALKTNRVGQFVVSTPVPNGRYSVFVTFAGEVFAIMAVNVLGEVLEPLEFIGREMPYAGN